MTDQEVKDLIQRYLEHQCSEDERGSLESWYNLKAGTNADRPFPKDFFIQKETRLQLITDISEVAPKKPLMTRLPLRIAAVAAAILFILGIATLIFKQDSKLPAAYVNDVSPGTDNNAILTLADGTQIDLRDAKSGALASQSGIEVIKAADGTVTYKVSGSAQSSADIAFNTIRTPNAGQAKIILADGSKVWLNAASSLKYPVTFNQEKGKRKQRFVELSGEAYFEVVSNQLQPFVVETDKQAVTVLGTHFNISSYPDETDIKTTLLEGGVRVTAPSIKGKGTVLRPGDQAVNNGTGIRVQQVDPDLSVAWKSGKFMFRNEPLESILRKISRWYNVEIKWEDQQAREMVFGCIISRYENISEVLCVLERTGDVKFNIDGRTVTVTK